MLWYAGLFINLIFNIGWALAFENYKLLGHDESSASATAIVVRNRRQAPNSTVATGNVTAVSNATFTKLDITTTTSTTTRPMSTTIASLIDPHNYYTTQIFDDFDRFWIELYYGKIPADVPTNLSSALAISHDKLSLSYRTAAVVDLKFTFPFYGHPVKRVVIATGGFIYVGEVLNPRLLTFSQFIAPLMANFDFSISTTDRLLYFSNETMLIVEWRDVVLQENPSIPFRFQVHIYRDGRIVFAYKDIPLNLNSISQSKHPVEVSLSDAYSSERKDTVTGASLQTMHVYSETRIPNDWVRSRSAVVITPLPTCVQLTTCSSCLTPASNLAFQCAWCPTLKRCSYGFDRGRKSWLDSKCDVSNVTIRSECASLPANQREGVSLFSQPINSQNSNSMSMGTTSSSSTGAWTILIVLIVLAVLAAVGLCVGWVVYAHRHPGSRAGIWLVEHRPARLLADSGDFFRRSFESARNFFSSAKPTSPATDHSNGMPPVVTFSGSNGQSQHPYDVSVGGVTMSASRI